MDCLWIFEHPGSWNGSLCQQFIELVPVRLFVSPKNIDPNKQKPSCLLVDLDCFDQNAQKGFEQQLSLWAQTNNIILLSSQHPVLSFAQLSHKRTHESIYPLHRYKNMAELQRLVDYFMHQGKQAHSLDKQQFEFKNVCFDFDKLRMKATADEDFESLSLKESKLLKFLVKNAGTCLTREQIRKVVWDEASVSPRTIDSHISRLRKKLRYTELEIENIYGDGYVLT